MMRRPMWIGCADVPASLIDCRRNPNGNMARAPAPPPATVSAMTSRRSAPMPGLPISARHSAGPMAAAATSPSMDPSRSEVSGRTLGACSTCTAMQPSGWRTAGHRTRWKFRLMAQPSCGQAVVRLVSFAAAVLRRGRVGPDPQCGFPQRPRCRFTITAFASHCRSVSDNTSFGTTPSAWSSRAIPSSLLCLPEVAQIRRRLILLGGHQVAVGAHEIVLIANDDDGVVGIANRLGPNRTRVRVAPKGLVDAPRPRQGVVEHRDLVMQDVRIILIEIEPLLES